MALPLPTPRKLTFGVFELDPSVGRLLKAGIPVKLPPQPFKVLLLLIDRPGQVVRREEIQRHLWGDSTFVDFERGINFSINQIRAALCDDVEKPRYIETLPKLGYRFVADLTEQDGHPTGGITGATPSLLLHAGPQTSALSSTDLHRPVQTEFSLTSPKRGRRYVYAPLLRSSL